jgi:hypothetical protein
VTVEASMGKHARYRLGDVGTRQQCGARSVRYFMPEGMHKYRCKNPHQKQTEKGKSCNCATPRMEQCGVAGVYD